MRRRGGFSLIELVLVMLLLIFVAVSVFLLTGAGSAAYIRLSDNRRASSDLRIALSYIDVRIKKMDGTGQVTVCPAPFGQGQALLLSQHIESGDYETYLYVDGGRLKELTIEKGRPVTPEMAADLASATAIRIDQETGNLLAITLSADWSDRDSDEASSREATQWIFLRSGAGGAIR